MGRPLSEHAKGTHWVLIETGGNQRYIFSSNRLRHVVGASQLVHEVGTVWVAEAVERCGLPRDTVVMSASGKALLLVSSATAGRVVVRDVTTRALREAPGLRVTGVVGPAFDPTDDGAHELARADTYALHRRVRAARPDPLQRDRIFPWHRLCRDSGQPAAGEEVYGDEPPVPASAAVLARSQARDRAWTRLRRELGERGATIMPAHLDDLRHDGWVAVVHADGNGIGGLFRGFVEHVKRAEGTARVSLDTHARYQRAVAGELDAATWQAVRETVTALIDQQLGLDQRLDSHELRGRLLPVVVGGDDVTLVCDAALAVPFVRSFADAFARHTARQPTLSAITAAATGQPHLTASAGIAVVKPHHPFATAYDLAEALTVSAKRFRHDGRTLAGFDIHMAHTSTLRDLAELREYVRSDGDPVSTLARHGGPYLLDPVDELPVTLRHRSVDLLDEVLTALGPQGWLSATQAHALREAADRSLAEYQQQLELTVARTPHPDRARELLGVQHPPAAPDQSAIRGDAVDPSEPFLRLFDALHLRGLYQGAAMSSTEDRMASADRSVT